MLGQDGTPRPSIWRVLRLHDDSGGLYVVLNNQMAGSCAHRELFYCAYDRHHRHRKKIRRKEMTIKEEPPGHLTQHAHRPLTTIWESRRYHIPLRRVEKHRHVEARIRQRLTTRHPQKTQEIVWNTTSTRFRPGPPFPPRPNGLKKTSRGDAPHHWGVPNVPHGTSRWRLQTHRYKSNQLRYYENLQVWWPIH